jgi:hypothetical protein
MTWIRQPHVQDLLRSMAAGTTALSHEALDMLPRHRTVEYVRGLLTEHGVLQARDRYMAEFKIWAAAKLETVQGVSHRSIVERFIRWHQLKRLRKAASTGGVPEGLFLDAKQTTTAAIRFLNWLAADGREITDTGQEAIDRWYAAGPSTNARAEMFLYWAISHRHLPRLEIPRRELTDTSVFGHRERIQAIRSILTGQEASLSVRIAAGLVLLFGQPLDRIAGLTLEQVRVSAGAVELRLAADWLPVPDPFASLLRAWVNGRSNLQTAAHQDSPWLFPGTMPGAHITPRTLSAALRNHGVPARLGRMAAWRQMVRDAPPSVLAELLGIHPATAMPTSPGPTSPGMPASSPLDDPGAVGKHDPGRMVAKVGLDKRGGRDRFAGTGVEPARGQPITARLPACTLIKSRDAAPARSLPQEILAAWEVTATT